MDKIYNNKSNIVLIGMPGAGKIIEEIIGIINK